MRFKEIVAPTIKELFVQQIEKMILSGQLRPGDRIPSERDLSEEMKISKTVVHEGIRELRRLGFVDVTSRRGVTVADYAQTGNLDTLVAIMRFHGGQLDKKTAISLLNVRSYLEGPAFETLAENHTDADVERLTALQAEAEAAMEDDGELALSLFRYHRTVAYLCGNTIIPLIFNAFSAVSQEFWRGYIHAYGAKYCVELLATFTDYIRTGDGKRASRLLRDGLNEYAQQLR